MDDPMLESFVAAFRAKWGWGFDPDLSGGQYDWWRVAWQAATAAERERCVHAVLNLRDECIPDDCAYDTLCEAIAALRSTPADEEPRT